MDYKNRKGEIIKEDNSQDKILQLFYSNLPGRLFLRALAAPTVSKLAGSFMNSWMSAFFIDSFIQKHNISMKEFERRQYRSYNQFFTRKIKSKYRPINTKPANFIAPCDGRVSIYPIYLNSVFQIKNSRYNIASLLRNKKLASEYAGGYCVILRLTVEDYHRYCYIDDAVKGKNHPICGKFFTVHPAILGKENIYKENAREYCILQTKNFGKVIQMEVGALLVGKIHNYHREAIVSRGEEKGRFEFGGSTVVLLVQREQVAFDDDILKNTRDGYETKISMGEVIGKSIY